MSWRSSKRRDADRFKHPARIRRVAVGEDEAAAGQARQRNGERSLRSIRSSGMSCTSSRK
jgi:hypothetical protein